MIIQERQRHAREYPYTIHPFSIFTKYWQIFMAIIWTLTLAIEMFDIPFLHTARREDLSLMTKTATILNFVCVFDIIVNLLTGYVDNEKQIELQLKNIFMHHLLRWFVVDLVTLLYGTGILHKIDLGKFTNIEQTYVEILRYIRILKVIIILNGFKWILDTWLISYSAYWTLSWGFLFFFFMNVLTSLYCKIGTINIAENGPHENLSWIKTYFNMYKGYAPDEYIYFHGLMECLLKFNRPQSFAIVPPILTSEVFFTSIIVVVGVLLQAIFIALLSMFIENHESVSLAQSNIEKQLINFMNHNQCSKKKDLLSRHKNIEYIRFKHEIFKEMPTSVKFEIVQQKTNHCIQDSALFSGLNEILVQQICSEMRFDIFLPNFVLYKSDDNADCIYYLCNGRLAVYDSSGVELYHLVDDHYFGLIDPDEHKIRLRGVTVVCIEVSQVLMLPIHIIHQFCKKSKLFKDSLKNFFKKSLEKSYSTLSMKNYSNTNFSNILS